VGDNSKLKTHNSKLITRHTWRCAASVRWLGDQAQSPLLDRGPLFRRGPAVRNCRFSSGCTGCPCARSGPIAPIVPDVVIVAPLYHRLGHPGHRHRRLRGGRVDPKNHRQHQRHQGLGGSGRTLRRWRGIPDPCRLHRLGPPLGGVGDPLLRTRRSRMAEPAGASREHRTPPRPGAGLALAPPLGDGAGGALRAALQGRRFDSRPDGQTLLGRPGIFVDRDRLHLGHPRGGADHSRCTGGRLDCQSDRDLSLAAVARSRPAGISPSWYRMLAMW